MSIINRTKKRQIEEYTRLTLDKWGLSFVKIEWMRRTKSAGFARFKRNKDGERQPHAIQLSIYWMEVMREEQWMDVVLHEVAHFLAGKDERDKASWHGQEWKWWARRVGARPQRCFDFTPEQKRQVLELSPPKYTATCPACGFTHGFRRKVKNPYSCPDCNPNRYDARFKLKIAQNY